MHHDSAIVLADATSSQHVKPVETKGKIPKQLASARYGSTRR